MKTFELILTHILNCNRTDLYLRRFSWNRERLSKLNSIFKRLKSGYPLAYLLGEIEFFGLNFKVKEGVFIPRQETEILVETTINLVKRLKFNVKCLNLLDIGTGSGCIAISLAKFLPNVRVIATDISPLALDIAKENARINEVEDEIDFIQSDLFPYMLHTKYYILISNPPYIPTKEIESLSKEVRYEPKIALDGGKDGLDLYRRIVRSAPLFLREDGFLILEIGYNLCGRIKKIFKDSDFKIMDIIKDYSGIDRVVVAQLKKPITRKE